MPVFRKKRDPLGIVLGHIQAGSRLDGGTAGLRETVLEGGFTGPDTVRVANLLGHFLRSGLDGLIEWFGPALLGAGPVNAISLDDRLRGLIDRDIALIDRLIGDQLDAILHDPRFQRFEGSWRGLAWLVDGLDASASVRVRVLSVTWREICRDLDRALEFDQSALFRLIYESEIGRAGGEPFGLLVVDHEMRHRPPSRRVQDLPSLDDIAALASLGAVAAAAFAPVVVAAAPELLGVDRFEDLALSFDPSTSLRDDDHARWRTLSTREDSRFLCITMPRVLARPPWTADPSRQEGFRYAEFAPSARERVWSVGCYAFASVVVRAQTQFQWPADIRGIDPDRIGGGLVPDLVVEPFDTDHERGWCRQSLDLVLTDGQERLLIDAGLIPLNRLPHGNEAVFASVRSMHVPTLQEGGVRDAVAAGANARISAQINSVLCVSRFAHYLKVMGREMVGSLLTADEIERRLQKWLSEYTNGSMRAGPESRARHPLVASRITVREQPDRPGTFGCVIHLQPHYQLDDIEAAFRLVTELSAPGSRN